MATTARMVRREYPMARGNPCRSAGLAPTAQEIELRRSRYAAADHGFRAALWSYGLRHGLPNLTREQILAKIDADEYALADKFEAELHSPSPLPRMDEQ